MITLDTTNARAFNNSLKKAINGLTSDKVKVEIINSYKFPNCWVRVYSDSKFTNDFRLSVFDAMGLNRTDLLDQTNVSYGNIGCKFISAYVQIWEKALNIFEAIPLQKTNLN